MDKIHLIGLFLNFIIYALMLLPILFILLTKSIYESQKKFISFCCIVTLVEILFSCFLYIFSKEIFSIFTKTTGIINYAVYASKIIFISSSLFGIKYLIPAYLLKKEHKKTAILVLSKIALEIHSLSLILSV